MGFAVGTPEAGTLTGSSGPDTAPSGRAWAASIAGRAEATRAEATRAIAASGSGSAASVSLTASTCLIVTTPSVAGDAVRAL